MGSVEHDTMRHLEQQAQLEELHEAYADEIEEKASELAREIITDGKQLSAVLDQEFLAWDLARMMRALENANAEFAKLPLNGNWAILGILQAANEIEKNLLHYVNDDDLKERAAEEVIPEEPT